MAQPKLLLIKWIDAQADIGWLEDSEVGAENPPVYSVGWLRRNEKDAIILAADIGESGGNNRRLEIQKKMIVDMHEITMEEEKKPKRRKK
jgi:hypothetical protein